MTLRLRTFGALMIERDGVPLGGAQGQRRRLALLAYLAAADQRAVSREKLVALLWPESDEQSARHSLSQLLYAIRHDLGSEVLTVEPDTVRLNHTVLTSDVRDFDDALRAGRFEAAVDLYRGPFLDGVHVADAPDLDRWADEERTSRALGCVRALDRLVDAAENAGDSHRAVEWLRRRLVIEPADGRATARLMRALAAIGDRQGAMRVGRTHEAIMRADFDAAPDAAVLQLAQALREPASPGAARGVSPPQPIDAVTPVQPPPTDGEPITAPSVSLPARRGAGRTWSLARVAAVTGIGILAIAVAVRAATVSTRDTRQSSVIVVIGDIAGPDTVLSLAVREALRAELLNTQGVVLTSDQGIRELRTLMRLSPTSPLKGMELVALATRGGAHVAVTGSVLPVGDGAQVVLELIDPATGRTVRTFTERPGRSGAVLESVDRLARSMSGAVSHALRPDVTVRPLPAVTTASLPALKSYAQARHLAATGRRVEAVEPAERAVAHDSAFVLAHYFLGDLLWFLDQQTHSEAHLTRAYELRATVPAREQLVIRARYEQLANDQPDSALAYWQLLADASPGDVLAYEGRTWALRALGRYEEAAASADTAMSLDPGALQPNITNAIYSWLSVGDTTSALALARRVAPRYPGAMIEARFYAALFSVPSRAAAWVDSTTLPAARHYRRHLQQVVAGEARAARVTLDSVLADDNVQMPPNALINQGWIELLQTGDTAAARRHARQTLEWTRRRDLSPPAIGRLAERIADLAARTGDERTVRATIALVRERDRGRSLRTYRLTGRALDAALAYAQRDYAAAARLAREARNGVYFSRSLATLVQLESDARRAAGEPAVADSLGRLIDSHQIVDGNFETWVALRAMTRRTTASARR